jgi:hypothetical protein
VLANAKDRTTTLAVHAAKDTAPLEDTSRLPKGYVLGGSTTIIAGGSALSVAGTEYSALSSGAGVPAIDAAHSTAIHEQKRTAAIEQGRGDKAQDPARRMQRAACRAILRNNRVPGQ